jgi:hypothetical protein
MKYRNSTLEANGVSMFACFRNISAALLLLAAFLLTPLSESKSQTINLDYNLEIKAAIQGLFDPATRSMNKNCEVEILLRDAISPSLIYARQTATIDRNTLTARFTFHRVFLPECYISVKSVNSIETFSSEPVALARNTLNTYDFTTSKTQAYGSNMFEYDFGGLKVACVYTGDINNDLIVDGTDYSIVENDVLNYVIGNVITDLTGDEFVDGTDLQIVEQSTHDYVQTIFPEGSVSKPNQAEAEISDFELNQNYPNPFNPSTLISFALNNASDVRLSVFDMSGRELATLVNENLKAGSHSYNWDASALSSGTYFYRLIVNGVQSVKQMQLVK